MVENAVLEAIVERIKAINTDEAHYAAIAPQDKRAEISKACCGLKRLFYAR